MPLGNAAFVSPRADDLQMHFVGYVVLRVVCEDYYYGILTSLYEGY
jgi:hypothetical protein